MIHGLVRLWIGWALIGGLSGQAWGRSDADTVVDIQVQGLTRVDSDAALAGIRLTPGANFDPALATQDLKTVWGTGFFQDVRLEKEKVPKGLRLVYVVVEKPSVESIEYKGRQAVSEDDIKGAVDIKPHAILSTDLIKKSAHKIKDLYLSKGYYLADVQYRIIPIDKALQHVKVVFEIAEHAKVMVRQISFIGNRYLASDDIKSAMQTREGNELSWLTRTGTYKEEFFQADMLRIQALYYDHGFVTVKVGTPTATLSKDRRYIYLAIPIEEGKQYKLGSVKFSGDIILQDQDSQRSHVDEATLQSRMKMKHGDIFNRSILFEDIESLANVYRDYGYAYTNITPNSRLREDSQEVDLELDVERGDVIYFERIEISGNLRTRDKVIRRELRIFEKEKYSASALDLSRARISQLGYFESVHIKTSPGSRPNLMNATVEIKERSTGNFRVGAGFSSVENFIATAEISQNNFLGQGQILALELALSFGEFARRLATFQFYEPYFLDSRWALNASAYINQRYYRDFQRNARGISPGFGYPLTHELRLSAGYTLERVEITTPYTFTNAVLYNLRRAGRSSAVNLSMSYDTRDDRLFPSKGMFHDLRGKLSSTLLGADASMAFKQLELDMRYYHPLPLSWVFKANLQLGWVFGAPGGVPISERYFPGGVYSVRGFEPRGLGPTVQVATDPNNPAAGTRDFVIGGNKQVVVNVELEIPLIASAGLKGVVFTDAGNAYNDDESFFYIGMPADQRPSGYLMGSNRAVTPPLGLFYSFGFGLRWLSPMGLLRFEWGIPITKHEPDSQPIVFELTVGNSF